MAGVVHHHIAIVIVAVVAFGWTARLIMNHERRDAGIALGAWIGVGFWFTPETAPLTMMALGAIGLAWVLDPARADLARTLGISGLSCALVTWLELAVDPPAAGIGAPEIDRLSHPVRGTVTRDRRHGLRRVALPGGISARGSRVITACAIGAMCCGLWIADFPRCDLSFRHGTGSAGWDAFFGHIAEMMPVGRIVRWHAFSADRRRDIIAGLWF